MATSMTAMMASSSGLGSVQLAATSRVNLNTKAWSVARTPAFVGRRGVVRCEAGDDFDLAKDTVEKASKNVITQEKSDDNQAQNTLESQPRPQLSRQPDIVKTDVGDFFQTTKEAVDKVSKKVITREQVEENQASNTSEKKSVFGTEPTSGAPYPRPEIERRPETGSRDLGSIFAFDGAAPETINGRLAMVGLVWAFFAEKASGLTVWEQLYSQVGGFGLVNYAAVVQLITFASIIPFINGESTDARSFGPFRAKAERWNGRLAMLGFLALVLTEQFIHSPVFAGRICLG